MDGKTKRFKNGDYRAYKFWTDDQWKGLSERDKAQWSEYSDEDQAPISKEVIDFTEENDLETKEPCCKEVDECKKLKVDNKALHKEIDELHSRITEYEAEINTLTQGDGSKKTSNDPPEEEIKSQEPDENYQKQLIKDKLTELGIPFRANTGLVKLKAKLEDANNTE